jgi:hypothetical protein
MKRLVYRVAAKHAGWFSGAGFVFVDGSKRIYLMAHPLALAPARGTA